MSDGADPLPTPAPTAVRVREDRSAEARCDQGFLRLRRLTLENRYPDGAVSAAYPYDVVSRDALDAVAFVLYAGGPDALTVCLRTALRPPLAFRDDAASPVQWELPAGLIEPGEDAATCAAREAREEVGAQLAPGDFAPLGPPVYLSPGVLAERLTYLAARVDPDARLPPTADGTPVEERAEVRFVPLPAALEACRDGRLHDIKTEVGLRRLAERGWRP